jgi:hypothetical protein
LGGAVFSDIRANPVGKNVNDGVAFYKDGKCDGIIAFGGGSALDVGKTIALMVGQTRPLWPPPEHPPCSKGWQTVEGHQ